MIGNDELSQRAKFLFVTYTGPNIKVLRKARLSVHVADVKRIVKVRCCSASDIFYRTQYSRPCIGLCRPGRCRQR